jgi:tetratricopeptide (TPR) repeat protein
MIDIRRGALGTARERLSRVVKREPGLPHAWRNLAAVCQDLGLWPEAMTAFRRIAALEPSDVGVRFALAAGAIALGRTAAGLKAYRELAQEPAQRLQALARLALIDPHGVSQDEAHEMEAAAAMPPTPAETRIALYFALGGVWEARGLDGPAFAAFDAGNRLKRESLEAGAPDQRPAAVLAGHVQSARHIASLIESPAVSEAEGDTTAAPIFIVGMPRSGSTLIEQILAANRGVTALGETAVLPRLLERAYPATGGEPFAAPLEEIARAYLQAMSERGWSGRGRFVDKTLENYLHVGVIRRMFPRAVILHSVRDPVDTCVACWRQLFNRGAETLYDLADIGAEYVAYAGLMAHWRAAGFGVIDVSLERLVQDPEPQIRWLTTSACGLPWDPASLTYWKAGRPVRTASATQVRQPMTTAGIGRWRRYEAGLQPLLDVLGASAPPAAPPAG